MKIYCVEYWDDDDGEMLEWFATKRGASDYMRAFKGIHPEVEDVTLRTHQLDPTRQGIVDWLRKMPFAQTDNG